MNCRTQKLLNLGLLDSPQVLPANDTLCRLVQPGAIPIPREDFSPHTPRRKSVDRIFNVHCEDDSFENHRLLAESPKNLEPIGGSFCWP